MNAVVRDTVGTAFCNRRVTRTHDQMVLLKPEAILLKAITVRGLKQEDTSHRYESAEASGLTKWGELGGLNGPGERACR